METKTYTLKTDRGKGTRIIFIIIIAFLVSVNYNAFGQEYAQIGTGTAVNGTTTSSPVNNFYRRAVLQIVYTKAELEAAGITPGSTLNEIGWYVTQNANQDKPGYTIKLKHVSASDVSSALGTTGWTTVVNAFTYPTNWPTNTWQMISFDTDFVWNGVDNIGVEVCWSRTEAWSSTGQCRIYSVANGYRYSWTDNSGSSCGSTPGETNSNKPHVRFGYSLPCEEIITDNTITANGNASSITVVQGESITIASSGGNTDNFCYWASNNGGASWNVFAQTYCDQASFEYTCDTPGDFVFHVRNSDPCGYCWESPRATDGSQCQCVGSSCVVNVTVLPTPTSFNLTGGGDCLSDLQLSGSEIGVVYQLKRNGISVGAPIAGTGSAISFGTFSDQGFYTVSAVSIDGLSLATPVLMNGEAEVPLCFCEPGTFEITSPHTTTNVLWYEDEDACADPIGDGPSITVELSETTTFYTDGFNADELTTGSLAGNSTSGNFAQVGQMFDIGAPADKDLIVTGMTIRKRVASQTIRIYYRPESYVNYWQGQDQGGWITVVDEFSGLGASSTFQFAEPVIIPAGCRYGFYTHADVDYTTNTSTRSNSEILIYGGHGGVSSTTPFVMQNTRGFSGTVFMNRVQKLLEEA